MTDQMQCPNCGAPIHGDTCDYCGTQFFDFACIDTEKPFYLKIKHKGEVVMFKVWLTETDITTHNDIIEVSEMGNRNMHYVAGYPDVDISMMFKVIHEESRKWKGRKLEYGII